MKGYACKVVRKDLSRSIYKNGISITEYFYKIFDPTHNKNFNITLNDLKSIISKDNLIIIQTNSDNTEMIKLIQTYYKSKEFYENEEELYNFAYTKNLFEEDKNFNALSIYKVIMDSEEITYAQISKHLKDISDNKINLDLKQVAHYCKELKKYNLVLVKVKSTKNNERVVVKNKVIDMYSDVNNKFNFTNRDSDDSQTSEEEENPIDENLLNKLDSKSFYKFSKDPEKIMEMSKEEKFFLQIKNQKNMNKNYLENRFSFYVDNICIENNILFHLLVKKEKGLTINEITFLLGLHGREKTTNRILSNMEKKSLIRHMNIRKGKKYEFCYMLREDVMNKIPKSILTKYENYLNQKIRTENETGKDTSDPVQFSVSLENKKTPGNVLNKTQKSEEINEKRNLSNSKFCAELNNFTNLQTVKIEEKLAKTPNRNSINNLDSFLNLANSKKNDLNKKIECSLNNSQKDETKIKMAEFKSPIKDNFIKQSSNFQDLNETDFKFIFDQIISNSNLQKIKNNHKLDHSTNLENLSSEVKRKILLDFFNAHLQLFKVKSINDVSYNRYIFTLNKISQNKFITVNELKVFILNELEKTIGFVIDRRTIKNLFMNLEKLGLIKTLEFELTMRNKLYNYMKNSEITQKKIVSISREIEVTDEVVEKLQEILLTRHTKATSSEIFFNDQKLSKSDMDDEEDMMESINLNFNTLSKVNFKTNPNSEYENKNIEDYMKNSHLINLKDNFNNSSITSQKTLLNPNLIKEEIDYLTSNLNLNVSYNQKNFLKLFDKITPLQEKYRNKFFKEFIENWKKFYFVKANLLNIFSRKTKNYSYLKFNSDDDSTDKLSLHKIFSNSSYEKVIVPKFLKDKLVKSNKNPQEDKKKEKSGNVFEKYKTIDSYFDDINVKEENSDNNNIADLITQRNFEFQFNREETIYNYQMINYFNMNKHVTNFLKNSKLNFGLSTEEQKFAKKYFKTGLDFEQDEELKFFMEKKRRRDEEGNKDPQDNYLIYLSKLPWKNITKKDKRFNSAHYKKIIDLIPLLRKIYFNPNIKIKRLSNLLPTFTVSSDILLHLNKLGILIMTREDRIIEDNFRNNFYSWEIMRNDVSLKLDKKSELFFDI